jgi:hypothetical protein
MNEPCVEQNTTWFEIFRPQYVPPSFDQKTETAPVSEMLCFLVT